MGIKLHVLANDGSPLGVTTDSIYGRDGRNGTGGAELAILTLCEMWVKDGHDVIFYNNPTNHNSPFEQRDISEFDPQENRDVLVTFRSPNPLSIGAKGKHLWFSTDQRTVGDFKEFAEEADEIITISPFHATFFDAMYGIKNTTVIDLPVRGWDYDPIRRSNPKVKHQCLFSSVPDRGLPVLAKLWPKIVEQVPDASLVITSGWSLWTGQSDAHLLQDYRTMFGAAKNVNYVGAVLRDELVKYQLQSDLFLHPCLYDELFCIACSEAQWAGAWPITSNVGALQTTNMGTLIVGHPNDLGWQEAFVEQVVKKLLAENLDNLQTSIIFRAKERFNTRKVLKQWEKLF